MPWPPGNLSHSPCRPRPARIPRRGQGRWAERGLTLLEVVVALTLAALALLFAARAAATILVVTNRSGSVTVAANLAARTLEEVRARVEAQPTLAQWTAAWDALTSQGRTPFAPPFGAYAYEILVDQVAMAPAPVPCRVARDPTGPPCPITGNAATESNLVKWVTVRVYHDGVLRAELSSAILRGMWWRS